MMVRTHFERVVMMNGYRLREPCSTAEQLAVVREMDRISHPGARATNTQVGGTGGEVVGLILGAVAGKKKRKVGLLPAYNQVPRSFTPSWTAKSEGRHRRSSEKIC